MTHGTLAVLVVTVGLILLAVPLAAQESEFRDGQWVRIAPPAKGSAEGELALVRHYVDRGQYRSAVSAADRYLKLYHEPDGREEVMLLAGESEMKRGRLFQGYEWFEKQLAEFSGGRFSNRALDREFGVAESFLAGKKQVVWGFLPLPARDEGLDILSRIADQTRGTPAAERAMMRIADDRYAKGEWLESAEAYDRYLVSFAKGSKAPEAMLKGAEAAYWSFTGIAHDETPLIEAEQRYRSFAQQYPISAKQAEVEAMMEQIRATRARKLLEEGRFYERIGKPQAAAYSYRLLINTYPQTEAAEQARLALEGLPSKQPTPRAAEEAAKAEAAPAPQKPTPAKELSPPSAPTTEPARSPEEGKVIDLEQLPDANAPSGGSP